MAWQKTLHRVLALQNRAKHLESSLHFTEMFENDSLLPSHILQKLNTAKEAKALYIRAQRLCIMFASSVPSSENMDAKQFAHDLQKSIRRISETIKVIDFKASQFGIGGESDIVKRVDTYPPGEMEAYIGADANVAADGEDLDNLKREVKHSLKALADIIEYMERPTLLKIRKEIDKLVNY